MINICLLFPFILFFISHSNVIHREICVKDFSGTTVPRILEFGTNVGCDFLYCVKENKHAAAYYSLICPFFFLSKQIFRYIFLRFCESQSLANFVYTLSSGHSQVYCVTENKTVIYSTFFFLFSISHSNIRDREICDKYFSGPIAHRIL